MRKLLYIAIAVIALVVIWLGAIGIDPQDRRPGTRLAGTLEPIPATWELVDEATEVQLETHPWWGIPYSVTIVAARDGNDLFAPSIYSEPAQFPGTKFWNSVVADNPEVRLRVGGSIFELRIMPASDAAEFDRGLAALARKYPFWQKALENPATRPPMAILKLSARF